MSDDLSKLETELEHLSSLFFDSVNQIQKYAPLQAKDNEEKMENSIQNQERIAIERIDNYQENKDNYENLIQTKANEINECFSSLSDIVNQMKTKEEFLITDDELKKNLKNLKESNELKVKAINDKIKSTEEVINNIKKENEINMHLLRYSNMFQVDINNYNN
jgi:hypothetical protein